MAFTTVSRNSKRNMPLSSPYQQQVLANHLLKEAMTDERSNRWMQVVKSYRRLVKIFQSENLPDDFDPPTWFRMFLYESYYHLGIALQHMNEHKKAVLQYTAALQCISIPKNGCVAGCNTNSCLAVPIHARRAFAYAKIGNLYEALKDAERTVVLDTKNPDVYCIRALVRNTNEQSGMALSDTEKALKLNSKHLCALILRGNLVDKQLIEDFFAVPKETLSKDHTYACNINADCHNYLSVQDFNHPKIFTFYERFLYSLNVPHTISEVDLVSILPEPNKNVRVFIAPPVCTPEKNLRKQRPHSCPAFGRNYSSQKNIRRPKSPILSRNIEYPAFYTKPLKVFASPMKFVQKNLWNSEVYPPFKCGMMPEESKVKAQEVASRMKQYSHAVHEFVNRPKTSADYLSYIEKQREMRKIEMEKINRPKTATTLSSKTLETDLSDNLRTNLTLNESSRRTKTTQTTITSPASMRKKIKAFEDVNVKDAPRMYYRPWMGDKLPVAYIEKKEIITPPFKP